jgi:hypothetical protein
LLVDIKVIRLNMIVEMRLRTISKKIAIMLMLGVAGFAGPASADNLVQNGNFETGAFPSGSGQIGYLGTSIANWNSAQVDPGTPGYNLVFVPGDDTAVVQPDPGVLSLYAPAGPDTLVGGGGNFIAGDPDFRTSALSQTIDGLVVGQNYILTFDFAGAQQTGFDGETTEGWQVSLGSDTQSTSILNNAEHGFTGWFTATMNFTATSTSEILSFLALGGPSGSQPPFALLDNVSLDLSVPEPMTLSVFGIGLVGAAAWKRRKASKKA